MMFATLCVDPARPQPLVGWQSNFTLTAVATGNPPQKDAGILYQDRASKMSRIDSTAQGVTQVQWYETDCTQWPDYHPVPPSPPPFFRKLAKDAQICSPNMLVTNGTCEC